MRSSERARSSDLGRLPEPGGRATERAGRRGRPGVLLAGAAVLGGMILAGAYEVFTNAFSSKAANLGLDAHLVVGCHALVTFLLVATAAKFPAKTGRDEHESLPLAAVSVRLVADRREATVNVVQHGERAGSRTIICREAVILDDDRDCDLETCRQDLRNVSKCRGRAVRG